jgi:hypothetical protein
VESGIGFLADVFNAANDLRVDVSRGVMLIGGTYVVFYCAYYVHLFKRGYIVSWQKYTMLVITAVFNIVACGTLHAGVAYFINELYHAAQYLVFVWFYERKNMSNLTVRSVYKKLVLACAVIATFAAGCWMYLSAGGDSLLGVCIVLTCLLMHYWWDGFIWSVRRKQV